MAETDNIILEHVALRDDIREVKQRLGNLENQYADISNRLDRVDFRIERFEKRLDLTDA